MEKIEKKNSWKKRGIAPTPGIHLDATMSHTAASRLESISYHSSFVLKSMPEKNGNPDSRDKALGDYEKEYLLYLLRVLQRKQFVEKGNEREKEVRKCLVSLKTEYEELVKENVNLYEHYHKVELYGIAIKILNKKLDVAREVFMLLKEKQFFNVLKNVNQNLEELTSHLNLFNIKKEDLEEAFDKSFLGFNSNIYILVNRISEYIKEHREFLPDLVELLRDIQHRNAANEELRKRCLSVIVDVRSCRIKYKCNKYLRMALEECKDLLPGSHQTDDGFLNEINFFGVPSSSSTPIGDN